MSLRTAVANRWLRHRTLVLWVTLAVTALWIAGIVRGVTRPMPSGLSRAGHETRTAQLEFLTDLTFQRNGARVTEQTIFDHVLAMIDQADRFIVIDMFLFNDEHLGDADYRPLTAQLTDRLLDRLRTIPALQVTFITDEINNFYGAYQSEPLRRLEAAGVGVVITDHRRLRDSNPMFSSLWRTYLQWFGTAGPATVPHPLTSTARRVTIRSYLKLFNFKANHRKVIVTEDGCMVLTANPHDASSFHSNVAFATRGALCLDVLEAERAVAAFSGASVPNHALDGLDDAAGTITASLVTEGRVRAALLDELEATAAGDSVDIVMFYLSDRLVVGAIKRVSRRGVHVRLLLDPNKDAFGRQKGGIPNRAVARELLRSSNGAVQVRWYDTHGEQFHTKLMAFHTLRGTTLLGGSANLTRRNIGDYNLEADLLVRADSVLAHRVRAYFNRLWNNEDGEFSVPYETYADASWAKWVIYRLQEFSGISSF